jgi:hypothetical protein
VSQPPTRPRRAPGDGFGALPDVRNRRLRLVSGDDEHVLLDPLALHRAPIGRLLWDDDDESGFVAAAHGVWSITSAPRRGRASPAFVIADDERPIARYQTGMFGSGAFESLTEERYPLRRSTTGDWVLKLRAGHSQVRVRATKPDRDLDVRVRIPAAPRDTALLVLLTCWAVVIADPHVRSRPDRYR